MKPATGNWQLKPLNSPDLPALVDVPDDGLTLGRGDSNGLAFSQERYPHVSSLHARISFEAGLPVVEDLGSSNGTLVNGKEARRVSLRPGDVLQLGRGVGPRLVLVDRRTDLAATVDFPDARAEPVSDSLGATTVLRLKKALGLPQGNVQLAPLLRARSRRLAVWLTLFFLLLAGAAGVGAYLVGTLRQQDRENVEELGRELRVGLERSRGELAASLERSQEELQAHRRAWEGEKLRLEEERVLLKTRIASLESEGRAASGELERLEEKLAATSERLAKYKPVDLSREAEARQAILEQSLRAVVYIEKRVSFRDKESGVLLHGTRTRDRWKGINIKGQGEPYYEEGGGSGFCVSSEGYVVTNAHVVRATDETSETSLVSLGLAPEARLVAVFSGTSERRPLKIVAVAGEGVDLALVKLEPFAGMPYLPGLEGDPAEFRLSALAAGEEVRLFGFPFGKYIPQDGDRLTASVFAGIVSRDVGKYVQVHAAIYPGNSGGPVVDLEGRLVGVVTSVQTMPSGQIASDIGFVVPAARLRTIWPPKS